ncbi:MAG: DNA internalization-related competence protein ComEC/Rec2 [Pseudomonadota bacterium]
MLRAEQPFALRAPTGLIFALLSLAVLVPVLAGPLPAGLSSSPWLLLVALGLCRWPALRLPACLLLLALQASQRISEQLDARYLGPPRSLCAVFQIEVITARDELPRANRSGLPAAPVLQLRFEARVLAAATDLDRRWEGQRLRLLARAPPAALLVHLRPGQRVWLRTRVRPPFGRRNPAGFDYERWLFSKAISATGTVLGGVAAAGADSSLLLRVREHTGHLLADLPTGAWLSALLLGDRSGLQPADWTVLRGTGTVHLLVVSGLHVSIVAVAGLIIGLGLGRALTLLFPAVDTRWPALLCAALLSAFYVGLTGTGIPAQRAWIMTNLALGCWAAGRIRLALPALLLALLLILLWNPLAALGSGLWLSFAAVGLLLLWFQHRRRKRGGLAALVEAQLVVTLGLQPVLSAGGVPLALAAPVANLIAVPLVSWLVLPLGLLALLLNLVTLPGASALINLVDALLQGLLMLLNQLSAAPQLYIPAGRTVPLAMGLLLTLLVCRPLRPGHWAAAALAMALVMQAAAPVKHGEFRLTVLDAGQGDAVLVETRTHTLLFDTGGAYSGRSLLVESTILPLLRQRRRVRLDGLVVSHDDLDHSGGEAELRTHLVPIRYRRSRVGIEHSGATACRRGERWQWDQVTLEFLHPAGSTARDGRNEQSCVLLIRNRSGTAQALLPGDIDVGAEAGLRLPMAPVTVVLVPHHGSRTSSSPTFVRRLRARYALVSAARFSRFGHPHPEIVRRYRDVGSEVVLTGTQGALQWRSDAPEQLQRGRCRAAYWARGGGEVCR